MDVLVCDRVNYHEYRSLPQLHHPLLKNRYHSQIVCVCVSMSGGGGGGVGGIVAGGGWIVRWNTTCVLAHVHVIHSIFTQSQTLPDVIRKQRKVAKITVPAVVDFPTPPFPDATNIVFLTPGIGCFLGRPRAIMPSWCFLKFASLPSPGSPWNHTSSVNSGIMKLTLAAALPWEKKRMCTPQIWAFATACVGDIFRYRIFSTPQRNTCWTLTRGLPWLESILRPTTVRLSTENVRQATPPDLAAIFVVRVG